MATGGDDSVCTLEALDRRVADELGTPYPLQVDRNRSVAMASVFRKWSTAMRSRPIPAMVTTTFILSGVVMVLLPWHAYTGSDHQFSDQQAFVLERPAGSVPASRTSYADSRLAERPFLREQRTARIGDEAPSQQRFTQVHGSLVPVVFLSHVTGHVYAPRAASTGDPFMACNIHCILPPHMLEALRRRGKNADEMVKELEEAAEIFGRTRSEITPAETTAQVHSLVQTVTAHATGTSFLAATANVVLARGQMQRLVHDGARAASLPGKNVLRAEGDPPCGDREADEAYDGAEKAYRLFFDVYKRHSLDDNGLALVSTVHHRRSFNNAFWNGTQMAYGDGDTTLFHPFTRSLSVIGHELTHGVVEFCGGLDYSYQSGALNEHIADVFGALTDQYAKRQAAKDANWVVGAELFKTVKGHGFRSLKEPGLAYDDPVLGRDPQPYHMSDFVHTSSDNGGVHINSGIPNHAFYLLAMYVRGNAWETAGTIWYEALRTLNNRTATFRQWADETVRSANRLHGPGSKEERYVTMAWRLVGVL